MSGQNKRSRSGPSKASENMLSEVDAASHALHKLNYLYSGWENVPINTRDRSSTAWATYVDGGPLLPRPHAWYECVTEE